MEIDWRNERTTKDQKIFSSEAGGSVIVGVMCGCWPVFLVVALVLLEVLLFLIKYLKMILLLSYRSIWKIL
ncbi:hypothetical protein C5167_005468 [Papaver somniferum]|uniref:Transmembrane protein n=1 Tax=Papaver somniferum TaxID=3469 RepID=A0A4Y7JBH2_PAPSO|nr:hypothetical protein C5167_005468 [Papaver somniferum]